jgi:hypothetical protein
MRLSPAQKSNNQKAFTTTPPIYKDMTDQFKADEAHISIAMPDGTRVRAYIDFDVYNTDNEGGKIISLDFAAFEELLKSVEAHRNKQLQTVTDH